MDTGTELDFSHQLIDLIQDHAPACKDPEGDAERILQLIQVQDLMRFEHLSYQQALEETGLSKQMVNNWRTRKPWIQELVALVATRQMDNEILSLLMSRRADVVRRMVDTALYGRKAADRRAAFDALHRYGYDQIDTGVETAEKLIAKRGEGTGQRRIPTAASYQPIFAQVNVYQTQDGRSFPRLADVNQEELIEGEVVDDETLE